MRYIFLYSLRPIKKRIQKKRERLFLFHKSDCHNHIFSGKIMRIHALMFWMGLSSYYPSKDKRGNLVIDDRIECDSRVLTHIDISFVGEHHLPHEIITRIDWSFIDDDPSYRKSEIFDIVIFLFGESLEESRISDESIPIFFGDFSI